jgi:secreted PhoX family phosphatase
LAAASTSATTTTSGRLRPENATVWAKEGKQLVVYTGDDARDKFLYKYVSSGRFRKDRGRRNSRLFEDGQLWVAEFAPASQDETVLSGTGRWHQIEMSPAALVDPDTWVRAQSWFNPATFQLNRPEDAEIDRFDNSRSVPNEAESTGPIWTPRQDTMFLAIQHPGEETSSAGGVDGDPERAEAPIPDLVVVPFKGHGFPRPDFVGDAELHLRDGKVAKVLFRAP